MQSIFTECRRVLKPNGIMTVMFTHKGTGAWDALTTGLIEAGFFITASWPVRTEAEDSMHIKKKAAAKSTIVLVCRPRSSEQSHGIAYWEDVEPMVGRAVRAVSDQERRALAFEEIAGIRNLVDNIARLPVDTKAKTVMEILKELRATGYPQAMVFTQFTDTMDFLREHLTAQSSLSVMCFSGRGGEVRGTDGTWRTITRDEVKRRFSQRGADILVCTDAAAEGLNFQFCGALVNYDMPWNPMRVEQRIGRIDRLGQKFSDIRIVNLYYSNTVEADVYIAARNRIGLFERVVGGLQPILAQLPKLIETTVLDSAAEPARTEEALRKLDQAIDEERSHGIDLDAFGDDELELPPRPDSPLTLADLGLILDSAGLLPKGAEARQLGDRDYRYLNGQLPEAIRVTIDREFFEKHSDSVEFWTPGSPAFPDLEAYQR
jgi:hypothetical protein